MSAGVNEHEPAVFNEPALYLVRSDATVYSAHVQSTPFARPHLDSLICAVEFISDRDYPARGEA